MAQAARLQGILNGTGPATEAQLQLRQGARDAASVGQQMAASARGTSALLQERQAQNAAVLGAQRANEQAALLRAKEDAQARGELTALAGGMRSQDAGDRQQSAGQAQFQTQTELQNRAQNDQTSLGYMGLYSNDAQAGLDARTQVALGNQGGANGMALGNAQMRSDADSRSRQAQAGLYGGLAQAGVGMMSSQKQKQPQPAAQPPAMSTGTGAASAQSGSSWGPY